MKRILIFLLSSLIFPPVHSQPNFTEIVNQTEKGIVSIVTYDKLGDPLLRGTGFFVNSKGHIASNFHIFKSAHRAMITLYDGSEHELDSILMSSKEHDIILFTVDNLDKSNLNPLKVAKVYPLKGEDIFTIGNPLGLENTVSKGIISSIRDIPNIGKVFQITAPISEGSSGSPVLNLNGEVFGVASFQVTSGQNLNFAIDIKLFNEIITNDAILSNIAAEKKLPNNKNTALQIIDSLWEPIEKLSYINYFIRKNPSDHRGYLERAQLFSGSGSFYALMDSTYKLHGDSLYYLGQSKTYAKSIPDFNKAIALNPQDQMIYFYRGRNKLFYLQENEIKIEGWSYQSALDDLLKCTNIKDVKLKYKSAYYRGLCFIQLSRFREALNSLDEAIKYSTSDSFIDLYEYYFERGKLKIDHLNDTIGALSDLDKAFELTKSHWLFQGESNAPSQILAKRANIKFDLKDYAGALDDLRKVNKSIYLFNDGHSDYTHYLHSFTIRMLDADLNEALEQINEALSSGNDVGFLFEERSHVFFEMKDFQKALIDINKVYELTPSQFDSKKYSYRSRIKSLLKDNIGAIKDIDIALKQDTKNDQLYFLKGLYLSELGDDYGAIKQYDKAIEINSKDASYLINRGWSKLNINKADACADWSKAGEMGRYDAYDLIQKYCK